MTRSTTWRIRSNHHRALEARRCRRFNDRQGFPFPSPSSICPLYIFCLSFCEDSGRGTWTKAVQAKNNFCSRSMRQADAVYSRFIPFMAAKGRKRHIAERPQPNPAESRRTGECDQLAGAVWGQSKSGSKLRALQTLRDFLSAPISSQPASMSDHRSARRRQFSLKGKTTVFSELVWRRPARGDLIRR